MSMPPLHEHKVPRINVKPPLLTIFWIRFGHRVTMETPNDCGVAEKSQLGHKYFLQYSIFASENLEFEHRGAKLASCPGRH